MRRLYCPHCGSYLGKMLESEKAKKALSPTQIKLFDILKSRGAYGATVEELALEIYGEPRGLNQSAQTTIQVQISTLRKRVADYGFHIPQQTAKRDKARYRLLPMDG